MIWTEQPAPVDWDGRLAWHRYCALRADPDRLQALIRIVAARQAARDREIRGG